MSVAKQIEKSIFETARELADPAVRELFLKQACNGQTALRERLDKLLAAQAPADAFFRAPHSSGAATEPAAATSPPATAPKAAGTPNTMLGRYRLQARLGEGGCGVVYLAEQQEPVRRQVALKIIRVGMDTESVIARFGRERQALALMDHPNIAHVFDAGATEAGRPYFVMEWVQGLRITDFCNRNRLAIPDRLKLFIQICHAIQHAHQKGVIHRDIKPSNILVAVHDGVPLPKVIDFGIAKATEGRLADNPLFTACDQFIGTPAYMSPEQAGLRGPDVDTRSDIYSLGVLLYELLSGHPPFASPDLIKAGRNEGRRILREPPPEPPSTMLTTLPGARLAVVAAQQHAEPGRLIFNRRGDLDWIVMKALEQDRDRRYQTANGLAMDVQRYLNHEPVVARPPSPLYQFQKLVRRNRVVFAATAAVAVALLLGSGVSTCLFLKERQAHRRAVAAEQQQIRWREESDRLRQNAEFREKLTAATFANSRDRIAEADRLVAGIPAPEPNLEYAGLYRTLGDWHAMNDRWKQAADRVAVLVQVNLPDDWDVTTLDYLRYGSLLLETGDTAGYDRFRRLAAAHFARSSNPVAAERILKVSLLTPANGDFLAKLQPLAATASNSLFGAVAPANEYEKGLATWRTVALALMEYRRGNYAGVLRWRQKSLTYAPDDHDCAQDEIFKVLLAMAHLQTGQVALASAELAAARQRIETHFRRLPVDGGDGYWFDWVIVRILLREATELLAQSQC